MKGIPITDWLTLAIGIIGLATAYLKSKSQLPAGVRKWLAKIGEEDIIRLISEAESFDSLSVAEKRARVVTLVQEVAVKKAGVRLPTSIANLLVEFVYQAYRRRVAK